MTVEDIAGLTDDQRGEVRKLVSQREAEVFAATRDACLDILEGFLMKAAERNGADQVDARLRAASGRVKWAAEIRERALKVWAG